MSELEPHVSIQAKFSMRIFRHPDGEWWVEGFEEGGTKCSWDAGGYLTYEEAREQATEMLASAFDGAFNCGDI